MQESRTSHVGQKLRRAKPAKLSKTMPKASPALQLTRMLGGSPTTHTGRSSCTHLFLACCPYSSSFSRSFPALNVANHPPNPGASAGPLVIRLNFQNDTLGAGCESARICLSYPSSSSLDTRHSLATTGTTSSRSVEYPGPPQQRLRNSTTPCSLVFSTIWPSIRASMTEITVPRCRS